MPADPNTNGTTHDEGLMTAIMQGVGQMSQPSDRGDRADMFDFMQKPGDFADFANLVLQLSNGNVAAALSLLPWSELSEDQREIAEVAARLGALSLGSPCNNRLGKIRECRQIADAAASLIELGGDLEAWDDQKEEDLPDEVVNAVILGDDPVEALKDLVAEKKAEAEQHRYWIAEAKRNGCYRDYTKIKDRIRRAVANDVRLPPESYLDELDYYTRDLIIMCKVSEAGQARSYITNIFQRRGSAPPAQDQRPKVLKIFGKRKGWED